MGGLSSTRRGRLGVVGVAVLIALTATASIVLAGRIAVRDSASVAKSSRTKLLQTKPSVVGGGDTTADRVLGQHDFTTASPVFINARKISGPTGVAIDRSSTPNRVWVADSGNNRALGWASAASFANGDPADLVLGQPDQFSSACNNGGVSANSLCGPSDITVDSSGNVYIADGNNRALEYDSPFTNDATADRVFGQPDFTSNSSSGTIDPDTVSPGGLGTDGANLFAADTINNRILQYLSPLTTDTTADAVIGQPDLFSGACNEGRGISASSICGPSGMGSDGAGHLFATDQSNNRVLMYNTSPSLNPVAQKVFGQGGSFNTGSCLEAPGTDTFCAPTGAVVDGSGNLYVADALEHRVVEYNSAATSDATADTVFGQGGNFTTATCNNGGITANSLCQPQAVSRDSTDNLYIADTANNRILEYDTPLTTNTTADRVLGQPNFTQSLFLDANTTNAPMRLAVDRHSVPNHLYVVDSARILGWNDADGFATGAPADIVIGPSSFTDGSGFCSNTNSLCGPTGIAVDPNSNLWVVEQGAKLLEFVSPFTTDTAVDKTVLLPCGGTPSASSACNPGDIAFDSGGHLYMADYGDNRVLEFDDPASGTANRVFGQKGSFTSASCNNGGISADSLCLGTGGLAVDDSDNLWVADGENQRVLEFDAPLANDTTADRVIGTGGAMNKPGCSTGNLCDTSQVALDGSGNLYVVSDNSAVFEFDDPIHTDDVGDRVFGQDGIYDLAFDDCNIDGNTINASGLCQPFGLALDAAGELFIADTANNRVLAYAPPFGPPTHFNATITLTPSKLKFRKEVVFGSETFFVTSTTSAPQNVTVTNTSATDTVTLFGSGAHGDFPVQQAGTTCGNMLAPLASCNLAVAFSPFTVSKKFSEQLTIDSNALSPDTVSLSGSSVAGKIQVAPRALNLGTVAAGSTGNAVTVKLTNKNPIPCEISGVALTGDFVQGPGTCSGNVPANSSCTFGVQFAPPNGTPSGERITGTMMISDGAVGSPHTIKLSGKVQ